MNLPIFVINIKTAVKRWDLVQSAGNQAGLNLIRVDAIDGKSVPCDEWVDIDRDEFALNTAREIFPGEYGCYRSHVLALDTFIEEGSEYAVILEDDILPGDFLLEGVASIIGEVSDFDVIKLVNHRASGFIKLLETSNGDEIGRTIFGPQGSAAAYLVSRKGAIKLVGSLKKMKFPWDVALERYWYTDTNFLTVKSNVLKFSEERSSSSIAPLGYGKKLSFNHYIRRGSRLIPDLFRRIVHGIMGPTKLIPHVKQHRLDNSPSNLNVVLVAVGLLIMASVVWVESDAYRFACLALVIPSTYFYVRHAFWCYDRPRIGVMGVLCILWSLYVLGRYVYGLVFCPEQGTGSAEGIYLFPLLYAMLGYAFWRFCRKPLPLVVCFLVISILTLLLTLDYSSIIAGTRATTFAHNNTIHAANAAGFILLFAFCFLLHITLTEHVAINRKFILSIASLILFSLSLINIFVLTSKGVWLALAVVTPIILISSMFYLQPSNVRSKLSVFSVLLTLTLLLVVSISWYGDKIYFSAATTFDTVIRLIVNIARGDGLISSMETMIVSSNVSHSAIPRLQLWLDAITIWSEAPIFGVGASWTDPWEQRSLSAHLPFNIFHNSFLEVGVRYGVTGLIFFGFLFIWSIKQVLRAARHHLIAPAGAVYYVAALVFFLLSNLTNSNIRLAIGESYMLLAAGFSFYCSYRLQEMGNRKLEI